MDKPDIATVIDSHFEEMTDLEQEIARYFLQVDTIQDDLSSQNVAQKLHISQAALTRFAKKCGFTGYREFIFNTNIKSITKIFSYRPIILLYKVFSEAIAICESKLRN